jgi:hypothetical protein
MSKSTTPLAQFSRDPVLRNALKLSAADAGSSFAVSEAITPELIAAYGRWLGLERLLLKEEMSPQPLIRRYVPKPQSELVGWSPAQIAELRAREQIVMDGEAKLLRMFGGFASIQSGAVPKSPVERFFLSSDLAIIAPPASTRAALVLNAVGCDWRA